MTALEEVKKEENVNGNGNADAAVAPSSTSSANKPSDPERDKALANSSITNSEENKLIKARIFVGNLPGDLRTDKGDIYDKFRKHGRIMGVSIHSRFAFVQFENESDAKTAVKEENHSEIRSARLEVKMAIEGRVTNRIRDEQRERRRSRSPIDRRRDSRDRERRRDSRDRDRERDRDRRGNSRDFRRGGRSRSPSPPYVPTPIEDRFCHPRTYGANDVELVVIRKQQGRYAESILTRLYECRITANVLFLAEHAALDGAVNEFGRCGTHYVVIIMPKHEETRAMTINMFEGGDKPREYRNLNVEEGVALINRHFQEHYPALARLRSAEIQGPNFYPAAPNEVTRTLNRVAEMSAVPTSSLDSAIRYLQEMRERTAVFEGLPSQSATPAVGGAFAGGRAIDVDPGIGKPYSGMDERSRAMMPNTTDPETLRESLLGLLKVNPLTGIPAAQAAAAAFVQQQQQQAAYGGGAAGDYRMGASGGYPGYAASLNPAFAGPSAALTAALSTGNMQGLAQFASDPVQLQKALASLGMLGQQGVQAGLGGGGGGVATASPVTQQQQSHQQQSHSARDSQQQQSAIAGYGSAGSGRGQQQSGGQQSEENGSIGYPSSHQQQAGGHGGVGVQQVGHSQQQASTGGGGGVGQYAQYTLGQNGHAQQGLTAGHMATLARGAGGVPQSGSSGQVGGATGGGGSMYVTTSGTTGAGSYMMQQAQQQQQPQAIQRTLAQQQTAYSARR